MNALLKLVLATGLASTLVVGIGCEEKKPEGGAPSSEKKEEKKEEKEPVDRRG